MGFFTRLIAGLVAASTLGAGLAGTAGAVDTTGTTGDAKGVVKLASDDTSGLPDHLVNGDFKTNYRDQWVDSFDNWTSIDPNTGKTLHVTNMDQDSNTWKWTGINGWNRSQFGWTSTQKAGGSIQQKANAVELQYDDAADNVYAELCAYEAGTAIYQDIKTVPGTLYKVRLKHASLNQNYLDKMQVLIGAPGHETPVEMTRTTVNGHGDKLNEKSTTIATKVTNGNNRHHESQWETYEGTYLIPDGQTTTRFTFRSIDAKQLDRGNVLDDIVFDKAYRLSYDKNASDASGQVPSNERGRENTVQPAKAKTNGTVKTVADENVRYVSLANGDFSYPSFSDIQKNEQETHADLRTFLKSDDGTLWYNMSATDLSKYGKIGQIPGFDSSRFAWSSTENGSRVELQQDRNTKNTYAEIVAQQDNTSIYQNVSTGNGGVLYKIRLKHASRQSSHADRMQVLVGSDTDHATPVEMTRVTSNGHGDKVGGKSTTITTKVSNTDPRDHGAQWETYEGYYQVPEGQKNTVFMFKSLEGFKEDETLPGNNIGNLVDDIEFSRSYKLTYDANSSDASGQVPSDTAANTVKQAKSKTNGSVRLAADDDVAEYAANGLPEQIVNGSFDHPSIPSWTALPESGSNKYNKGKLFATINPGTGKYGSGCAMSTTGRAIPNWNRSSFAWNSTQGDAHYPGMSCEAGNVELNYDSVHHNQFAELTADQQGTAIYQDVKVTPGTMMKWSLKHSSATSAYVDKMQVMIGEPYKETAQEVTRIASENGNKVGEKMTTISTPTTSDRADNKKWDTYTGTYLVPDGVTTVRFTFKSVASAEWYSGNDLDDIEFSRSYRLTYDKNSSDAAGEVPSNQRGKENTVQPAKSKTTGTVKTVVDTSDGLPTELVNGDFEYPGADVLSQNLRDKKRNWWGVSRKDKMVYESDNPTKWVSLPSTFDSDRFAWDSSEAGKTSGVQEGSSQWHTNEVELQRDSRTGNMYAELSPYQAQSSIRQYIRTTPGALYKVRLKHASLSSEYLDKMQVLIGADGNEQPVRMTRVESQNGLDAIGESTASTTISTHASNKAEISWGSGLGYHSSRNHHGQWATYEGVYVATSDVTVFTFKSVDSPSFNTGNLLDDVVFTKAYKLTYDKNSADASGEVPSNQRGRENTTQPAKDKTSGTVRLASDDDVVEYAANGLPKQLVNSDFDHDWRNIVGQSKMTDKYNFANVDPAHGDVEISGALNGKGEASKHWVHLNGFDAAKFGWKSNQTDTRVDGRGGIVEIQRSKANDNMYAEITASQANTYLYQDIDTAHDSPTVYTVKLRYAHRNGTVDSNEKIQILVGAPGHEQPVEMTRIASDRGNKVGEKSTTVNAPNTDGWLGSWDTFQGSVEIPAGQPVSRFTFKALGSIDGVTGNLIDDVQFKLAYPLSYDKNAGDATGSVPSSQYGKENTVKPAKAKTTGTVRTVTDKTSDGLTVHDLKNGEIAPVQYGDFKFSTIDGVTADQITDVNGFTVKTNWNPTVENQAYAGTLLGTMYQPNKNGASLVLHHVGQWRDSSGTQRWLNAKITVNGQNLGSLVYYESQHKFLASYGKWDRHTSSRPYMDVTVDFLLDDGSMPQGLRGVTGFTDLDGGTSGYNEGVELVSGFDGAYVRSDAHLARFGTNGWAGATDENENNADAHGMKHYVGATFTGSSFHVRWSVASGQARGSGFQPVDSTIAYRLTYDKNAQDATGSIPSDTAANTTRPAKSETDGKVSDLVQRTTTHEDGSVTVRTVDQSTDVVSGCQVYYPAGQRITLATLAKDGDCWDSSMLTRPGHTQLGWSQDSQATQAQAEVTMVEGGMTVYAVWVGNPVLTYDTNKPNTWNGQMPSTPASVSVAYNTAAADGSGWQSGDTSKIRGYRFLGWYAGPQDDAGLYDWNTLLTGNVTVYAHWQRLQANVVYDANGGTGSHGTTTGWQYSDVTVPSDASKSFKRDGYVFLGWDTQADGNGTAYKDGSQVPLQDKDITLYAQWQPVFEQFTPTGGVSLPLLVAGGVTLLVMGIGSTVMLTRRMRGEQ